jgi:hypothetical protein
MVAASPRVSTETLVLIYRLLSDYKATEFINFGSIIAIFAGFVKLPPMPRPSLEDAHSPFISIRRKRRTFYVVGAFAIGASLAALWFHFHIPSEIGRDVKIHIEDFRHQLIGFHFAFLSVLVFQAWYWFLRSRLPKAGGE